MNRAYPSYNMPPFGMMAPPPYPFGPFPMPPPTYGALPPPYGLGLPPFFAPPVIAPRQPGISVKTEVAHAPRRAKPPALLLFGIPGAGCSTIARALVEQQGMQLITIDGATQSTAWDRAAEVRRQLAPNAELSTKGVVIDVPILSRADAIYVHEAVAANGELALCAAVVVKDDGRALARELKAAAAGDAEYISAKHRVHEASVADVCELFTSMSILHELSFPTIDEAAEGARDAALKSAVGAVRTILFQTLEATPKRPPFIDNPEVRVKDAEIVRSGQLFQHVMHSLSGLLHAKKLVFPNVAPATTMVHEALKRFLASGTPQFKLSPVGDASGAAAKCLLVSLGDTGTFVVPKSCTAVFQIPKTAVCFRTGTPSVLWCTLTDSRIIVEDCLVWEGTNVAHRPYLSRVAPLRGVPLERGANKVVVFEPFVAFSKLKPPVVAGKAATYGVEMLDAEAPFEKAARLCYSPAIEFALQATREGSESVLYAFVAGANGPTLAPLPMDPNTLGAVAGDVDGLVRCVFALDDKTNTKSWRVVGASKRGTAQGWPTLQKAGVGHVPADLVATNQAFAELVAAVAPAVVEGPEPEIVAPPRRARQPAVDGPRTPKAQAAKSTPADVDGSSASAVKKAKSAPKPKVERTESQASEKAAPSKATKAPKPKASQPKSHVDAAAGTQPTTSAPQ